MENKALIFQLCKRSSVYSAMHPTYIYRNDGNTYMGLNIELGQRTAIGLRLLQIGLGVIAITNLEIIQW